MLQEFKLIKKDNLQYYTIPLFENTGEVICAFTTRNGGVSEEPYNNLNLAFHVGDDIEKVWQNRKIICDELGIDATSLVTAEQVHGELIKDVVAADMGQGALEYTTAIPATDALMTNIRGVPLATFYADCVPVFLMDTKKQVIALAHAGWKGTVLRIGQKTVDRMSAMYGCQSEDMIAAVAPSIGPCCFEVDNNVMEQFKKSFSYWRDLTEEISDGKWKINLWEANKRALMDAGLKEKNITVSGMCTSCNKNIMFSYRGDGGKTGRMAALLMLK